MYLRAGSAGSTASVGPESAPSAPLRVKCQAAARPRTRHQRAHCASASPPAPPRPKESESDRIRHARAQPVGSRVRGPGPLGRGEEDFELRVESESVSVAGRARACREPGRPQGPDQDDRRGRPPYWQLETGLPPPAGPVLPSLLQVHWLVVVLLPGPRSAPAPRRALAVSLAASAILLTLSLTDARRPAAVRVATVRVGAACARSIRLADYFIPERV